ncbi:hypothetical protein AB0D10_38145 [Kitasatospora sp. NPDC048545]|uniref:hypothetical protein n=1 Tax=Kitasatospora sp. NPDC048545 TaxID=3157208 RepID=UPI0033FE796E
MIAVNRDDKIAALRKAPRSLSEELANVPAGSASHAQLLGECEAITAEIEQLKACVNIPSNALLTLLALAAVAVLALIS